MLMHQYSAPAGLDHFIQGFQSFLDRRFSVSGSDTGQYDLYPGGAVKYHESQDMQPG
jgi:hypothetical protein